MPPKPQAHRGDLKAGGIRTPGDFAALSAGGEWDAGELGCGHLLIELRKILREMPGESSEGNLARPWLARGFACLVQA